MRPATRSFILAAVAAGAAASASPALAADKFLGRFGKWEAHQAGTGADAVCFIATLPAKTDGKVTKRGEATLMIAHFVKRKAWAQVQVKAGFALKKGSSVDLAVGDKRFKLVADNMTGFGEGKENADIVAALKAGSTATATELPTAGPKIVDSYSLDGFSKALAAIDKACKK
jgi:hypothetical protein